MRFGLTVEGGQEAAAQLRDLPAKLQRFAIYNALNRSAQVVQQAVQRAAPVGTEPTRKTRRVGTSTVRFRGRRIKLRLAAPVSVSYDYGHLRDNIRRRRERFNRTGEVAVSVTKGRAFWAFFLEQGTRRMRAHPFWQRASKSVEAEARAEFEKAFRAAMITAFQRKVSGR